MSNHPHGFLPILPRHPTSPVSQYVNPADVFRSPVHILNNPEDEAYGLLWELLHLVNGACYANSGYVNYAQMLRRAIHTGMGKDVQESYQQATLALAVTLVDTSRLVTATLDALKEAPLHNRAMEEPSYQTLTQAADYIPSIAKMIPKGTPNSFDIVELHKANVYLHSVANDQPGRCNSGFTACWKVFGLNWGTPPTITEEQQS